MIHTMLPSQYLARAGSSVGNPNKRLMAAVLQTAVDDWRGSLSRQARGLGAPLNRRATGKARAYMASADRAWAFSFERLCEALDIDPGSLRRELGIPMAGRIMDVVGALSGRLALG